MDDFIFSQAEKIWNYHRLNQPLEKADAILVLCSHDFVVAERAAQIFLEGLAPYLIFSGGLGKITKELWSRSEAEQFAAIAVKMGVPESQIIVEKESTNTGENIEFTKKLLAERNLNFNKFIVVQKPYMERRAFATFKKLWADKEIIVTSPQISFDKYLNKYSNHKLAPEKIISIMVGDLQRIKIYPDKGFQITQEIPGDVWQAFENLVRAGFIEHLVAG